MTELVLSCPRFMRNLSSHHAGRILCPPRIPVLTVHWSVIGLGDTGWHCPPLCIIHWVKSLRGQAGQLSDNQLSPFLFGNRFTRRLYFQLIYIDRHSQKSLFSFPHSFEHLPIFYSSTHSLYHSKCLIYVLLLISILK